MAENKTKPTKASVKAFLDAVPHEARRKECRTVLDLMKRVTGEKAVMWGESIIGFGNYHYKYDSGHEGDCCVVGFAPRKNELTLYMMRGFDGVAPLLKKLGKHRLGKSCLYIKKLEDVDMDVLEQLVERSFDKMAKPNA